MLNPKLYTRFLPAERLTQKLIEKSYKEILSLENINEVLNAISSLTVILNKERQIIFANTKIQETLGFENINQILGCRPGEMLGCKYSDLNSCGCGTTDECTVCGAANAIKECIEKSSTVQKECRIITKNQEKLTAYNFIVTVTPLKIKSSEYLIMTLTDISDTKRKEWLESIFYHDIINIAGSINGVIELMKMNDDKSKHKKYLQMAGVATKNLIDEILSQRSLNAAEKGDLQLNYEKAGSLEVINEAIAIIENASVARNKKIAISNNSTNISFTTDNALLKRILINLIKNALEASSDGETVTIGCSKADDKITFEVHNTGKIPEEIQYQIFQRSFSTKSKTRGLGTYSVKLLTERYLKGTASFTSEEKRGTTFKIVFPIHVNPIETE